jgi:formamidopyrimidine-DNA glycosylase
MQEVTEGKTFQAVERRAKYLLFQLSGNFTLLGHLGMSGSYVLRSQGTQRQNHDHVIFELDDGRELVYHDPRRFGLLLAVKSHDVQNHPLLQHLGVEPLSNAFNAGYLADALKRRKGAIKNVLMDQKLVVGVGNIYASEALFHCGIDPQIPASSCLEHTHEIVESVQTVLQAAIESGGSTLRNYATASGDTGYFQHHFAVYGKEGEECIICSQKIRKILQAGRSTFFCQSCQKAKSKQKSCIV